MSKRKKDNGDSGWKVDEALSVLQASIDPYIWDQGQDLARRGAVKDFAVSPDGNVRIIVLDPRDARNFFVNVVRERDGRVVAKCPCPYRLNGRCRHQVVALEYLREVAGGGGETEEKTAESEAPASERAATERSSSAVVGETPPQVQPEGPVLYRLFATDSPIPTCPDGSVLRVVLFSLGSLQTPHRVGLQLYTGKGWNEVRTADMERWIQRGSLGVHPRDALLASTLVDSGELRSQVGSETLAALLSALAGSEALVDRSGRVLQVHRTPWALEVELVRADPDGIAVVLTCADSRGEKRPLSDVALVPAVGPWIQLETGEFHPLQVGVAGPLVLELQEAELSDVSGEELDRFLIDGVPQLERLAAERFSVETGLIQDVEGVESARLRLDGEAQNLSGVLEFSYGGEWVVAPETPAPWTVTREGQIHRYPAAGQSLARCRAELEAMGFANDDGRWQMDGPEGLAKVLDRGAGFVRIDLPDELATKDLVSRAPRVELVVASDDSSEDEPSDGRAAGSLLISVQVTDGERAVPIDTAALLGAYEDFRAGSGRGVLQLDDETVLGLNHPCVRELAELLVAAQRRQPGSVLGGSQVSVPATVIGRLVDAADEVDVEFTEQTRSLAERLKGGAASAEAALLRPDIAERLRSYQESAVGWFGDLARWQLAGILADEMGLGKTVMTLAHFFGRAESPSTARAPLLVVCPTSLVFNWLDESLRFFPEVRPLALQGRSQSEREEIIVSTDIDLLVTSYALLRRDREALESREFCGVVLDEAQHIKNAQSQTAKAAYALRSPERWALTGTPIENHLGELWSVFHFLLPEFLGTQEEFRRDVRDPADRGETEVIDDLRRRVRPFILRRTKSEVLSDLPPCIEQTERVPLTDRQRQLYEAQLLAARTAVDDTDSSRARFKVLAALTRLRQVCCDPRLVADEATLADAGIEGDDMSGSKFELLFELLEECIEEKHRVLLFSQFTSMLDLIEAELDRREIARCRLDGSTRDREGQVRRFEREREIPLFLISLKAGGHGLNLTGADTVILYDPWWNPATEAQAIARAHRIGQELPVHVHRLITVDTIEEKIQSLQEVKRDLASRLLEGDEESLAGMDLADLRELLE